MNRVTIQVHLHPNDVKMPKVDHSSLLLMPRKRVQTVEKTVLREGCCLHCTALSKRYIPAQGSNLCAN